VLLSGDFAPLHFGRRHELPVHLFLLLLQPPFNDPPVPGIAWAQTPKQFSSHHFPKSNISGDKHVWRNPLIRILCLLQLPPFPPSGGFLSFPLLAAIVSDLITEILTLSTTLQHPYIIPQYQEPPFSFFIMSGSGGGSSSRSMHSRTGRSKQRKCPPHVLLPLHPPLHAHPAAALLLPPHW
jgi:hypothetical protein